VKQNLYFIVLLFISHHKYSTAQVKSNQNNNNTKTTELESTRQEVPSASSQGNFVRVSGWDENHSNENAIELPIQKVKNVAPHGGGQIAESSLLKEISNSYWRTQTEIKTAKSQNNLVLLEELETNSLSFRMNYVSLYETLDASMVGVEQVKLYYSFKKDFDNE